jgi:hypothetical protein
MGFHDAAWWTRLMSRSHHCVLNACFSMDCHKEAWDRWLQCDHPYAIRDRDMMKAEGGKIFRHHRPDPHRESVGLAKQMQ